MKINTGVAIDNPEQPSTNDGVNVSAGIDEHVAQNQEDRNRDMSIFESPPRRIISPIGLEATNGSSSNMKHSSYSKKSTSRRSFGGTFEKVDSCLKDPLVPRRAMKIQEKDEADIIKILLKYKRIKLTMNDETVKTIDVEDIDDLTLEDS